MKKILLGIATGRGGHLTSDAGFQDSDSRNGVEIIRPLKDFSFEEIRLYNDDDPCIGETLFLSVCFLEIF
jgi:hypothetical protein